ncbi:NAD(P)H-hydrate dehydratase [Ramlibacter albus]|uniref:Bifunctional NAD(P)H-hydrate repair enzyme n=1 Tax=Ramlibacter albus TaxID=2079448 RepID=A0A923MBW1_9BURK|nr:NAD(P)H-hydrate dehydratase [Ramlibacter albus]MBC5766676.1 NAD(P)H-hydrate dehydratase [Ramlibacter albus]
MHRIVPGRDWPLFDTAAIRRIEQGAASALPPHTLMERAGLAVARLALAIAPHARTVWVAAGPGNNGGDGLEAAMHLKQWGKDVTVSWLGEESRAPADAKASLKRARDAGVTIVTEPPPAWDLAIDALLGIGTARAPEGAMREWIALMNAANRPVLAVDLPSGLSADTGRGESVIATHTLSLLALKPGLFTGRGRDAAGEVWFDDLQLELPEAEAAARLGGSPQQTSRLHDSHKGSYGDVAIIGGAMGMTGAALLAATAALHHGAGRVFVGLLDGGSLAVDPQLPDAMFRPWESLRFDALAVACGCGGGDAVRGALPRVLSTAKSLVLDADALNAIAADPQLQALLKSRAKRAPTVITPHPLEAARLLEITSAEVQGNRLSAARELAQRFGAVTVLKGSGTVIAAPGETPRINPTGNARLAIAGTGDVLAGMIAARLASGASAWDAALDAVYMHGAAADSWPANKTLTASALARGG